MINRCQLLKLIFSFLSLTHTHTCTLCWPSSIIWDSVLYWLGFVVRRTTGAWFGQKESDEWLFPQPYKASSSLLHWCVDSTQLAAHWVCTLDCLGRKMHMDARCEKRLLAFHTGSISRTLAIHLAVVKLLFFMLQKQVLSQTFLSKELSHYAKPLL